MWQIYEAYCKGIEHLKTEPLPEEIWRREYAPKEEVINDLKRILSLEGVVNDDKLILFETLSIIENKNVDFVDALLCAKQRLQGMEILNFDNDIKKCHR